MSIKNIILLFCYVVLLFSNCVQEFDPPRQGYENLLVVEAFLSNDQSPFEVKLSRSVPIDTSIFVAEQGAAVTLSSNQGEQFELQESSPGIYSAGSPLDAQVGVGYQLHIQTRNGKQYISDEVTMRATPPIEQVSWQFEEKPGTGKKGVQVYVDAFDPTGDSKYYLWSWDETWEFTTPFDSYLDYVDEEIVLREERINRCWKFDRSTSIDIATTKNLTEDRVSKYPLHYVDDESDRLGKRYSILVKQYSLSEQAYNYWKELQKITENLGTLFDPQPSTVVGNIHSQNDDQEIVLGYFDASTVSEKRIFITRGELPPLVLPNYYYYCTDSIVNEGEIPAMVEAGYWLVDETINEVTGFPAYTMSIPSCIDCTLYGTNQKPDYWP